MRSLRMRILAGLVVIVALTSLAGWIGERTSSDGEVMTPTLQQLAQHSEDYQDKRISVAGDVRVFAAGTSGEHWVLEEAGQYRVAIRGLPKETLQRMRNGHLSVEGIFRFEDGVGRYIDVTQWATPAASATP